MSTLEGHSALHALHSTHRSSESKRRLPASSSGGSAPAMIMRSIVARPRVECSSSRVAMKEGHMPPSSFRQAPWLLQPSTWRAKPPSAEKSMYVGTSMFDVSGEMRRFSRRVGVSMILPGFMVPSGSKAALSSLNAP